MMWKIECADFGLDHLYLREKVLIKFIEMTALGWYGLFAGVVKDHVYVLNDFIDRS